MATRRRTSESDKPRRPPAMTPEGRENQMIAYAVDLAEKQMIEGTASSQLITHYVKLGSSREKLEQERLARENDLLRVKAEAIESAKHTEELYGQALNAMRQYAGQEPLELDEYDEERR
jgi:hypothetical protein